MALPRRSRRMISGYGRVRDGRQGCSLADSRGRVVGTDAPLTGVGRSFPWRLGLVLAAVVGLCPGRLLLAALLGAAALSGARRRSPVQPRSIPDGAATPRRADLPRHQVSVP